MQIFKVGTTRVTPVSSQGGQTTDTYNSITILFLKSSIALIVILNVFMTAEELISQKITVTCAAPSFPSHQH